MNDDLLIHWFTYHPPVGDGAERYERLRRAALEFARAINRDCPDSPDKTVALRKVREAVMTANASIALGGA